MASPCWAPLPRRRSSWWASAPQAEKSSGNLQKSFGRPSQKSMRWNRYTSSVRKSARARPHRHTQINICCSGWTVEISVLQGSWRGNKASSHRAYTPMAGKWTHTQDTAPLQVLFFCSCSLKCITQQTLCIYYSRQYWKWGQPDRRKLNRQK